MVDVVEEMGFPFSLFQRSNGGGAPVVPKNKIDANKTEEFWVMLVPPRPRFRVSCPRSGKDFNDKNFAGTCRLHLTTTDAPPMVKDAVRQTLRPSSNENAAGSSTSQETNNAGTISPSGKKDLTIRDWLALRLLHALKNKLPEIFEKSCPRCGATIPPSKPEIGPGCRAVDCSTCKAKFCHLCDHAANFPPQINAHSVDPCHAHVAQHTGDSFFCEQDVAEPMQRVATLRRLRAFFALLRDGRMERSSRSSPITDDFWDPAATMGFVTLLGEWRKDMQAVIGDFAITMDANEVTSMMVSEDDAVFLKQYIIDRMGDWLDTTDLTRIEKDAVLGAQPPATPTTQALLNDLENGKSFENATKTNVELCSSADVQRIVLSQLFPSAGNARQRNQCAKWAKTDAAAIRSVDAAAAQVFPRLRGQHCQGTRPANVYWSIVIPLRPR